MTNNAGVGFGRTRGGEEDLSTVCVTDDLAALRNVSRRFFPAGDDCFKSEGIRGFLVSVGSLAFAACVTNSHMACTPLPLLGHKRSRMLMRKYGRTLPSHDA